MTHDDDENEEDQIINQDNVKTRQTAATVSDENKNYKEIEPSKKAQSSLKLSSQNHSSKSLKNVKTVEYQLDEDDEDEDVNDFDVHREDRLNM